MTDPDEVAAKYDAALVERILDKPDTVYSIGAYGPQLTAKVGIHSCVLTYYVECNDVEEKFLIPADKVATLIDWLESVFHGNIDPAPPGEDAF